MRKFIQTYGYEDNSILCFVSVKEIQAVQLLRDATGENFVLIIGKHLSVREAYSSYQEAKERLDEIMEILDPCI